MINLFSEFLSYLFLCRRALLLFAQGWRFRYEWPADVSPAVAAVQETVVGRSKMILAAFLFGFNDETTFSLENSSGA